MKGKLTVGSLFLILSCVIRIEGNEHRAEKPVYLGCYSIPEENNLMESDNTFLKLLDDGARDSCSDWCVEKMQTTTTLDLVVLIRGNQCICSAKNELYSKIPELIPVQDDLCDLFCADLKTLKCGGKFFYSIYFHPAALSEYSKQLFTQDNSANDLESSGSAEQISKDSLAPPTKIEITESRTIEEYETLEPSDPIELDPQGYYTVTWSIDYTPTEAPTTEPATTEPATTESMTTPQSTTTPEATTTPEPATTPEPTTPPASTTPDSTTPTQSPTQPATQPPTQPPSTATTEASLTISTPTPTEPPATTSTESASTIETRMRNIKISGKITFTVVVNTTGYIGFGISSSGNKNGSDIVALINIADDTGFLDLHGTDAPEPFVDEQQDWELLNVTREDGMTMLEFSRMLDTGDSDDIPIGEEDVYLLWAYSRTHNESFSYHGASPYRGAYKINLMNPVFPTQPPTDVPTTPTTVTPSTTEPPIPTTPVATTIPPDPTCKKCTKTDQYGVQWSACVDEVAIKKCPRGSSGTASWECSKNGFVGPTPNFKNCKSEWLENIKIPENKTLVEDEVKDYLTQVETNLKNISYYGHEINEILSVGRQLLVQLDENAPTTAAENFTDRIVGIFGDVMVNGDTWLQLNGTNLHNTSTQYVLNLEASTLDLATRASKNASFIETGIYDRAFGSSRSVHVETGAKLISKLENTELTFPAKYSSKDSSYIKLPSNWTDHFAEEADVRFVGIQIHPKYVNSIFPQNINSLRSILNDNGENQKIINGNLMSFTFETGSSAEANFSGAGVSIIFQHEVAAWGSEVKKIRRKLHDGERPKAVRGSSVCVYWHPTELQWSKEGCKLVETQKSVTECECDHLTAFAVLFDVHQYVGKDIGLQVLTWMLCPLSIVCLTIAIIVLINTSVKAFPIYVKEITIHLCCCLLVSNMIMLIFMDRHYVYLSEVSCTSIAILTHYFLLCAFSFMALEGFMLYKMVFIPFGDVQNHRGVERIWNVVKNKYSRYVTAYGVPALIVAITAIISVAASGDAYGADAFCWLQGDYVWGFIGPVLVVVTGNLILLVMTLVTTYNFINNPKADVKREHKSSLTLIKRSFSVNVLLGTTWIFGFLMLIQDYTVSNIAAYFFTILNASQGICLFVFHVAMNKKIQEMVRRRLHLRVGSFGVKPTRSTETETGTGTESSTGRTTNSS